MKKILPAVFLWIFSLTPFLLTASTLSDAVALGDCQEVKEITEKPSEGLISRFRWTDLHSHNYTAFYRREPLKPRITVDGDTVTVALQDKVLVLLHDSEAPDQVIEVVLRNNTVFCDGEVIEDGAYLLLHEKNHSVGKTNFKKLRNHIHIYDALTVDSKKLTEDEVSEILNLLIPPVSAEGLIVPFNKKK